MNDEEEKQLLLQVSK